MWEVTSDDDRLDEMVAEGRDALQADPSLRRRRVRTPQQVQWHKDFMAQVARSSEASRILVAAEKHYEIINDRYCRADIEEREALLPEVVAAQKAMSKALGKWEQIRGMK